MDKFDNVAGTKIYVDGEEYFRVDGIWFIYNTETEQYTPVDKPDFESLYKETFNND